MPASLCLTQFDVKPKLVNLLDLPKSTCGAPEPILLADEHRVAIGYFTQTDSWAMVCFKGCRAHALGSPNDEALDGHPLCKFGLDPYASYEVKSSPWIAALERANRVHDRHMAEYFDDDRHFILTFHDSLFECVANDYTATEVDAETIEQQILALHEFFTRK